MEKNSVFYMGTLNEKEKETLNLISQKLWKSKITTVESIGGAEVINFLPLDLKGSSPVFLLSKNLFFDFEEEIGSLSYQEIRESKNNCLVGVVLLEEEKPEGLYSEENKPDFFIALSSTDENIIFFL